MSHKKYSKYSAKRTTVDGITFASKREANRWGELLLLQRAGLVRDLERQPRYRLQCNGEHICDYVADFRYFDVTQDRVITEDAKGVQTPVYKLKKKLMHACYGITIHEV